MKKEATIVCLFANYNKHKIFKQKLKNPKYTERRTRDNSELRILDNRELRLPDKIELKIKIN